MKLRLAELKEIINEAAQTVDSLPANVKLAEDGTEWSHVFFLVDEDKLPDVEEALLGGISFTDQGGRWDVNSVNALHGYGPLLYRLAMEWVGQEMKKKFSGRGLKRSTVMTRDAGRVWNKFKAVSKDPTAGIERIHAPRQDDEYVAKPTELPKLMQRKIELTPQQLSVAQDALRSLNIKRAQRT